jgi:hypothetical protein
MLARAECDEAAIATLSVTIFRGNALAYNCDLFVFGPELAMLRIPLPVCVRFGLNSSLNGVPQ